MHNVAEKGQDYVQQAPIACNHYGACNLQVPLVNAWPSLSPVGSMTMLGSDLKDEEILPESPAAEPHDLIPSYLPGNDTQASTAPHACHPSTGSAALDVRHLAFLVQNAW